MLGEITRAGDECWHQSLKHHFRALLPPDCMIFNHEFAIDLIWLEGPILHIVDTHTHFPNAVALKSISTGGILGRFRQGGFGLHLFPEQDASWPREQHNVEGLGVYGLCPGHFDYKHPELSPITLWNSGCDIFTCGDESLRSDGVDTYRWTRMFYFDTRTRASMTPFYDPMRCVHEGFI